MRLLPLEIALYVLQGKRLPGLIGKGWMQIYDRDLALEQLRAFSGLDFGYNGKKWERWWRRKGRHMEAPACPEKYAKVLKILNERQRAIVSAMPRDDPWHAWLDSLPVRKTRSHGTPDHDVDSAKRDVQDSVES